MSDTHAEAHRLHRAGLPITLCPPGGKNPLGDGWDAKQPGKGWQRKEWSLKEIDRAFKVRGELNPGVLYGPRSGLLDIECDSGDGASDSALAELFDGDVPVAPKFQSKRGPHRIVRFDEELNQINKATIEFGQLEIKLGCNGLGAHSLWPPAVTGKTRREWIPGLEYFECDAPALPKPAKERLFLYAIAEVRRKGAERKKDCDVTQKTQYSHEITGSSVSSVCHASLIPSSGGSSGAFSASSVPKDAVQRAISLTVPREPGRRHRGIFEFARQLKSIPSLALASEETLRPFVEWWHEVALPVIATKAFEETWFDFRNSWKSVRFPAGEEPIAMMYASAISKPMPKCADRYSQPQLQALVALCRELQDEAGDDPIFLAGRNAAAQVGVEHRTAARWLQMLCLDGILRLDEQGSRHQASEYRYLGD